MRLTEFTSFPFFAIIILEITVISLEVGFKHNGI